MEKSLKLSRKNDRQNLAIALKALTKLDIIKYTHDNKVAINNEIELIKGKVRCSSKGYCFVVREDMGEDIYIREEHINNAWHGDSVFVKITKEGIKRRAPEGIIQCVIDRYNDILLARIETDELSKKLIALKNYCF